MSFEAGDRAPLQVVKFYRAMATPPALQQHYPPKRGTHDKKTFQVLSEQNQHKCVRAFFSPQMSNHG